MSPIALHLLPARKVYLPRAAFVSAPSIVRYKPANEGEALGTLGMQVAKAEEHRQPAVGTVLPHLQCGRQAHAGVWGHQRTPVVRQPHRRQH